jgi:hypothetical protein
MARLTGLGGRRSGWLAGGPLVVDASADIAARMCGSRNHAGRTPSRSEWISIRWSDGCETKNPFVAGRIRRYKGVRGGDVDQSKPRVQARSPLRGRITISHTRALSLASLCSGVAPGVSGTFDHGWTHKHSAERLGLSDRQVRRGWVEACLV